MAVTSEFSAAINQICAERGIDQEKVFEALESAIASAYKKEIGDTELENVTVEFDRGDGSYKILAEKEVVKKVEDENAQISISKAQKINDTLELGDIIQLEIPLGEFGRIAAQTAKQVILQQIRISEKEAVMAEFSDKVGQVFTAMMQRMQGGRAVFEIGKATAFMPQQEQIASEFYRVGQKYKVLLKEIEDDENGKTLIVSRSDPEFLIELFRLEVPEIESGAIEVKACAREAGSRSKLAVISHQDGVDPIGSCVGQRGVRIANVMNELGEEKIDIIEWAKDPEEFVANALSPAKVLSVEIKEMEVEEFVETSDDGDDEEDSDDKPRETEMVMREVAIVKVEEDQLSLAIGKDGQNVRLAHKLTGYKIDIQGPDGTKPSSPKADDKKSDDDDDDDKDKDNADDSPKKDSAEPSDDSESSEKDGDKEEGDKKDEKKDDDAKDDEKDTEKDEENGDKEADAQDDEKADKKGKKDKKDKKVKKKSKSTKKKKAGQDEKLGNDSEKEE
ncbi:transcription termination factor NusA [Candidatus Dojkabacteria bacterium]|nr:transcription termination factor NusA [Candidatus Dojkabacteria bacterium]